MAHVLCESADRILTVTMNRPEALNALDDGVNDELTQAWAAFEADDGLDVAILTANGRAFCAGADLKTWIPKWENATMLDVRKNAAWGIGGGITRGRHRMTKPLIAAVNGIAFGGGFEMALACDIRIASEAAQFAVAEVKVGLHQGDGGLVRLMAVAGLGTALDLTLTGRTVSAAEAFRLGLVSKVVAPDELLPAAREYARMIAKNSQRAIRSAKETALDLIGRSLDDALRLETVNAYSCPGDFSDVRRRLASFGSKSKPADA